MATTLTNKEIISGFQRLQMIGQAGLPIKVSYAATQTKKNLTDYVDTFQDKTEDLENGTEEFEEHLSQEIEGVQVHQVSASDLDGSGLPPELFIGLGFLFRNEPKTQTFEMEKGEFLNAINSLYRWAGLEFKSGEAIVSVANILGNIQEYGQDMQKRLSLMNQRIETAKEEDNKEELSAVKQERGEYLGETTTVTSSLLDLEDIADNEQIDVAPMEIESLGPFLK